MNVSLDDATSRWTNLINAAAGDEGGGPGGRDGDEFDHAAYVGAATEELTLQWILISPLANIVTLVQARNARARARACVSVCHSQRNGATRR